MLLRSWSMVLVIGSVTSGACAHQQAAEPVTVAAAPAPTPAPALSFDLAAVTSRDVHMMASPAPCTLYEQWDKYWRELPAAERDRAGARLQEFRTGDAIPGQYVGDPYAILGAQRLYLQADALGKASHLIHGTMTTDLSSVSDAELETAMSIYACTGTIPPSATSVAAVERRKAHNEEAACSADKACVAKREAEHLENLRTFICGEVTRRKQAKANVKEEFAYARESGVVDVGNLNDNKKLMILHDQRTADGIQEYESLSGKKFSAKTACR